MKRLTLSALLHTRTLAVVVILTLALLLLTARALAPFAESLRDELVVHLEELLGKRVEVGALTLRFDGWSPRLTLTDVKLSDQISDQAAFSARELRIDLNLLATWSARRPRIAGLTLVGAALELHRNAQGQLEISGLQALGGGRDPGALAFFLHEGRFALSDSHLTLTDSLTGTHPLTINIDRLLVENRDKRHRMWLDAYLASDHSTGFSARACLRGEAGYLGGWNGELHTRLDSQTDLAPLLRPWLPEYLQLRLSGLRFETWWSFDNSRPVDLLARLRTDTLSAARRPPFPATDPLTLTGLSALAHWSDDGETQHLRLADLRAHELGDDPLSLALSLGPLEPGDQADQVAQGASATRRLLGGLGELELEMLRRLANLAVPEVIAELPPNLGQAPIAGHFERIVFALDLPARGLQPLNWRVKGQIDGLGLAQAENWPGAQGLKLEFDAQPERGFARVSSQGGVLDFRPQLAVPTPLTQLHAQADWRIEPAGSLRLRLPQAWLQTQDLNATLRAELCLHRSASPYVDLHLQLREADASAIGRYLPVQVLDPPLVDWLNRAVRGGQITQGDFLLRGRLVDFPFDDHQGRFEMNLQISDALLDYSAPRADAEPRPGWPALAHLAAEVLIVNRRLDIRASAGRFLDSNLEQGSAFIPNLWQPERMIIKARGHGPFSDGRRVLLDTPLEEQLGRLGRAIDVAGSLGITLELGVPFSQGSRVDFQGALQWNKTASAHLSLGDGRQPLMLNDLQGELEFSNSGVRARQILAQLGDQPIRIHVHGNQSDPEAEADRTRIEVTGQASLQQLTETFPSRAWSLVAGDPHWQLVIGLSNQAIARANSPIDLELRSGLEGVSLNLPEPLGKTARTSMPLSLSTQLVGQELRDLALQLGPLHGRLALAQTDALPPKLRSAALAFNAKPPAPPDPPAISLSGRLPTLHLSPWLDWLNTYRGVFAQDGKSPPVRARDLVIDRLTLGTLAFEDLTIALEPSVDGGTRVDVRTRDNDGTIDVPPADAAAPIKVKLAHWRLGSADSPELTDASVAATQAARTATDPRRVGSLEIRIDELHWDQYVLGQLRVRLVPEQAGVSFQDLRLSGPLIDADGNGHWRTDLDHALRSETTSGIKTGINLNISSPDAGKLLRAIGLYQGLDGGRAEISARLDWPGDPGDFAPARATGRLDFDFSTGRLLDVNPGVGRMLGILNMAAIQRRLNLDFSDVIEDGFSFDQVRGTLLLADGLARTEYINLLSSTADIRITGSANLVERTLDQTLTVTPKVGSSVALASAVVGGPLVGAAVLLADRVAGGAMDRLGRHEYQVTGAWLKPEINPLGLTTGERAQRSQTRIAPPVTIDPEGPGKHPPPEDSASKKPKEPAPDNLFLENF